MDNKGQTRGNPKIGELRGMLGEIASLQLNVSLVPSTPTDTGPTQVNESSINLLKNDFNNGPTPTVHQLTLGDKFTYIIGRCFDYTGTMHAAILHAAQNDHTEAGPLLQSTPTVDTAILTNPDPSAFEWLYDYTREINGKVFGGGYDDRSTALWHNGEVVKNLSITEMDKNASHSTENNSFVVRNKPDTNGQVLKTSFRTTSGKYIVGVQESEQPDGSSVFNNICYFYSAGRIGSPEPAYSGLGGM